MKLSIAIGKRIQELLFSKNITQYRLAKLTCLSQNCISNIIRGKNSDINFSTIYLIAQALNISLVEFLNSRLFDSDNIEI